VLLVVYWSTWCATCTEDLPVLRALYERGHAKGFEIVGVSLDVTADAVRNLGFHEAFVEANTGYYVAPRTKGYQAQASFGNPATLSLGAWRGTVGYRYLQRDAVIDAYTDSDFHYFGGTNARGYYIVGDVGVAHNTWVRVRYLSANQIDGPTFDVDTLQLDLNTRF